MTPTSALISGYDDPTSEDQPLGMTEEELLAALEQEINWATERHEQRVGVWEQAVEYFYLRQPLPPEDDEDERDDRFQSEQRRGARHRDPAPDHQEWMDIGRGRAGCLVPRNG